MERNSGKLGGPGPRWQGWNLRAVLVLGLVVSALLAGVSPANAGQASTSPPARTSSSADVKAVAKPSTQSYQLPPERYQKAVSLARKEYTLYFVAVAWGVMVLLALLQTGMVARLRDMAESASPKRMVQALIFVPGLMLLLAVLHLPISIYAHRLSLQYQQSVQGWSSWFLDWAKEEALFCGAAMLFGSILLWLIRRSRRRWWASARM